VGISSTTKWSTSGTHWLDLFSELPPGSIPHRKPIELVMSADALMKWKNQIVATSNVPEQVASFAGALFDLHRCIATNFDRSV